MATWTRLGTGTAPTATDADLIGNYALDNATAPPGFDPAAVTSVRTQWTITGSGFVDDSWDNVAGVSLVTGATELSQHPAEGSTTNQNVGRSSDHTDSTGIPTGLSTAQWEAALVRGDGVSDAWCLWNKVKSVDGSTLTVSALTVIITYTPAAGSHELDPVDVEVSASVSAAAHLIFQPSGSGSAVASVGSSLSQVHALTSAVSAVSSNSASMGSQYLTIPDTTSHNATTPDTAVLDIVGDIDVRVRVRGRDYITGTSDFFIAKYIASAGNRSWRFGLTPAGAFEFRWSEDGTATLVESVTPSLVDETLYWVRVTLDVDNGASNYDCKFWTADGSLKNPTVGDFSQVGATQNGTAVTSIHSSATKVAVGSNSSDTEQFAGDYYRAQIFNGIDGTLVADFNANDFNVGDSDTATAVDSTGRTWTINGAGSEVFADVDQEIVELSGSVSSVAANSASLIQLHALTSAIEAVASTTADLKVARFLDASAAGAVASVTAELDLDRALDVSPVVSVAEIAAGLHATSQLSGSVSSVASNSAQLTGSGSSELTSSVSSVAATTASLIVTHQLSASVSSVAANSASLIQLHALTSTVSVVASDVAGLKVTRVLSASVASVASNSGELALTRALNASSISSVGEVSGVLAQGHTPSGSISAVTSSSAGLHATSRLSAAVSAVSSSSAQLTGSGANELTSSVSSVSSNSATLAVSGSVQLTAVVSAVASSNSTVDVIVFLVSESGSVSSASATLDVEVDLAGQFDAVAVLAASLTVTGSHPLSSSLTAITEITAALKVGYSLSGQVQAVGDLTAVLTSASPITFGTVTLTSISVGETSLSSAVVGGSLESSSSVGDVNLVSSG